MHVHETGAFASEVPRSSRCRGGGWQNEVPGLRDVTLAYVREIAPGVDAEALLVRVGPPGANEKLGAYHRRLWRATR